MKLLSIEEFKKLKDERLRCWLKKCEKNTLKSREKEMEIVNTLKQHYQWQDLQQHHLAYIARILRVELNIRITRQQKSWIKIKPTEFYPDVNFPSISIKHSKRLFIENLQEEGGWHYNWILFPEYGIKRLNEA